jgi:hypothetical protein
MNVRQSRLARAVALTVVVAMPLLGMAGIAAAKASHHHHNHGGTGSGAGATGGAPGPITVQIDPSPLVETGASDIDATIQVETSPSFAGDLVNIDSSQLQASCGGEIDFLTAQGVGAETKDHISVYLDNDGNATVVTYGQDCAPGNDVVEADLEVAPFYTALGTLVANPPVVTTPGVFGYPTYSGTVAGGETENGDFSVSNGTGSGCWPPGQTCSQESDIYAIFYVETNPVYAEQPVEISSTQLQDRCGLKYAWGIGNYGTAQGLDFNYNNGGTQTQLDDDGNAVFVFYGESCAAGPSEVIADVMAGTHPTYTTTFNVNPPAPTI